MPTRQAFSDWQSLDPMGIQSGGVPGNAPQTYPGNRGPEPFFRDPLDAMRAARIPTAQYPSGYLGTIQTRRQDRIAAPQSRVTQRSYQRGIHVGARVDPQSYFWTEDVNPTAALEAEAQGQKWTATGSYVETHLTNRGKPGPTVRGSFSLVDPYKQEAYKRLAPGWR